jgi:hypothetical protein
MMKPVKVLWVDSCAPGGGWHTAKDLEYGDVYNKMMCTTYGMLIEETDEWVCVALSKGHKDELIYEPLFIPKVAITEITDLKE